MKSLVELKKFYQGQTKVNYNNFDLGVWTPEEYVGVAEKVSKRALDAFDDPSKRSETAMVNIIAEITGDNTDFILKVLRKIIHEDLLEYHHVSRGRGKKKSKEYFYNADQIVEVCENYDNIKKEIIDEIEKEKLLKEKAKVELPLLQNQLKEMEDNAVFFERKREKPNGHVIVLYSEMKGKYGFFESNPRYNCPEYYTGYIFETYEKKDAYRELKCKIETLKELIYG